MLMKSMKLMKPNRTLLTICLTLAGVTLRAQGISDWNRIERLRAGEIILVTDDSGAAVRGRFLRADADSLLLYAPSTDMSQLKVLEQMSRQQPAVLSRVDLVAMDLPDAGIRVGTDGVWKNGTRVASFAQVFHLRPHSAIVSIARPQDQRHSYWGTLAGVGIGGAAGWFTGAGILLSDAPCQPHCGKRVAAAGAAMVGGPILGGVIGHALTKPRRDAVIYRR
jgi:hypothetical protein